MLGLQARTQSPPSELVAAEPEIIALLSRRLKQLRAILHRVGEWWLGLDFRYSQLPVLMLALAVWIITARMAWQSEESATPLLRQSISQIRQGRTRAAMANLGATAAPRADSVPGTVTTPGPSHARPAALALSIPNARVQTTSGASSGVGANRWITSVRSWFSPEPAAPERVKGNSRRRVWVDLKTGLYYCPGADYYGYGGAERGKVMRQRDAEYEYFQSATGAPCQ